jgi:hypothetical protein
MPDMGKALREELLSTTMEVRVSLLAPLYGCYSSGHKWMRGKPYSREAYYSGFYAPKDF